MKLILITLVAVVVGMMACTVTPADTPNIDATVEAAISATKTAEEGKTDPTDGGKPTATPEPCLTPGEIFKMEDREEISTEEAADMLKRPRDKDGCPIKKAVSAPSTSPPTSTPKPAPKPTSTPKPTPTPDLFAKTDCSKLADYWKGKILKNWVGMETTMRIIVEVWETGRTETMISCKGTARISDGGDKIPVKFTYERYPDGKYWHDIRPDF